MRRNAVMVDAGAVAMLGFVAGRWSPGTRGCMRLARAAGIPVLEYRLDGTVVGPPKTVLLEGTLW